MEVETLEEFSMVPLSPLKLLFRGFCCAGIIEILKSIILPIAKSFLKLLDIGLYSADIYSDIGLTKLLWDNCHYRYFGFSIATMFVSYMSTVLYLKKAVRQPVGWIKAICFPIYIIGVTFQKFLVALPFKGGM